VILGDTIFPWLLGTLLLLAFFALAITVKSWREMKRSPYFFLRRQAEKRMETYSLASLFFLCATIITSGYAFQTPVDDTARVAILTNAKPPKEEIVAAVRATDREVAEPVLSLEPPVAEPRTVAELAAINEPLDLVPVQELLADLAPAPPEEFDELEPVADLESETMISRMLFSTELAANYVAVNPRDIFAEGNYTLYATFDYEHMVDGLEWSWVWSHNGATIDGGNELWQYGNSGPGYIYLNPLGGFQNGQYGLEVWVNGELMSQASVTMNNAAVAAGN
jgi:hypothetical protein